MSRSSGIIKKNNVRTSKKRKTRLNQRILIVVSLLGLYLNFWRVNSYRITVLDSFVTDGYLSNAFVFNNCVSIVVVSNNSVSNIDV